MGRATGIKSSRQRAVFGRVARLYPIPAFQRKGHPSGPEGLGNTAFSGTSTQTSVLSVKEEWEVCDDYVQLRVLCKTTDTPTPCHLFKDPNANGKWRVKMNCLN